MRGLRRATHTVRFDAESAKPSDEDIRRRISVPSVESMQWSGRLLHLALGCPRLLHGEVAVVVRGVDVH